MGMKDYAGEAVGQAAQKADEAKFSSERSMPCRWYGRFRVYDGSGKKPTYVPPPNNWDGYGGEAA
jgi:hypothetical protein